MPLLLNASTHDALLAVTSHLPHITAAALVHMFMAARDESEVAQQLIATGWRDSTRIAAGSPEMWRDICLANGPALTRSMDDLISQLQSVRKMLADSDSGELQTWFEKASTQRRKHGYFPRAPK
jgi:prephenate dehydrogenase